MIGQTNRQTEITTFYIQKKGYLPHFYSETSLKGKSVKFLNLLKKNLENQTFRIKYLQTQLGPPGIGMILSTMLLKSHVMMKVELSGIPFLFDNDLKNGKEIHKHCFNCFTMMMRHFLVYFISSNLNLIKPNSMCKSHFDTHYIVCIKTRVSNASGFYLCAIASLVNS